MNNSEKALKDYIFSADVSTWLASSIISHYGFYCIDYLFNEFDETCKELGIEENQNIECLIFCDGEFEEAVNFGEHLRNTKVFKYCIENMIDFENDYQDLMELVKIENIAKWYVIKNA